MTNTERRVKFFEMIARLSIYAQTKGLALMPFGFFRTAAAQIINLIKGTSSIKRSFHQDWLAIDFVIIKNGEAQWERSADYEDLGLYWESMGGIWGGRWNTINDIYHFQHGVAFENITLVSRFLESFKI
jgi:hypothetical protein